MRKGGCLMGMEERIAALEKENQELRDDNEKMIKIIDQMRVTLNRLINHCLSEGQELRIH